MPEVSGAGKKVYERNRSSWSAVRVDAGEHVDFFRGFVLSTAERSRVTHFTSDKAYGRAAVSQGDAGKRLKNHGVFLRYSYSLALILPLLASDTPVLPSGADALGFLRA